MRARLVALCAIFLCSQQGQALACAVCSTSPQSKSAQSMAIAIWFLMAAVMSVLGGVGAFSFVLWRRGRLPLEPHQELAEEDLNQYG